MDGITRNPYPHWDKSKDDNPHTCPCEVVRHDDLTKCADCSQNVSPYRVAEENKWKEKIRNKDVAVRDIIANTHECGVTVDWLLAFTFDHDCWDRPTWWVNRYIVKEATRECRSRYMHLPSMRRHARPARVFMSHCWGSKWGDVVLAACHGARSDRMVWIDLFAVRQWPGRDADMNFRAVTGKCAAMIVSFSPVEGLKRLMDGHLQSSIDAFYATPEGDAARKCIPTCRLWCNVEIAAAVERNVAVVVKGGRARRSSASTSSSETYWYDVKSVGHIMRNLEHMVDVEGSACTSQADYDREIAIVREMAGGVNHVNKIVSGVVSGAAGSIDYNVLEIDAYVCGEKESLRSLPMEAGCARWSQERIVAMKTLLAAGCGGRTEIVRELLARWRGEGNDDERTKWLRELIDESVVVWYASGSGHADVVSLLLGVPGVNVNVVHSAHGDTALFQACQNGFSNVVRVLLAAGNVDINKQADEDDSFCPLFTACAQGHTEIVKLLLARKEIHVNQSSSYRGGTPLFVASLAGNTEIVQLLLKHAKIDVHKNSDGHSALGMAKQRNHHEIVRLLTRKITEDSKKEKKKAALFGRRLREWYQTQATRWDDVEKNEKLRKKHIDRKSYERYLCAAVERKWTRQTGFDAADVWKGDE